ncbi:MAG TPA: M56 family metallopeptidase [Bacteroidales bacterium]|nr:M56 family metallopeptidase [Bacteroidales bacterium]
MNPLLIYMLKVAVFIAAFYSIYSFLLSRDTMYGRNRTFILLSLVSSFILPLITIETGKPINIPFFGKIFSEVFVTDTTNGSVTAGPDGSGLKTASVLLKVYLTGALIFSLKLIIDFLELVFLTLRKGSRENRIIRFQGLNTAGFSAMGRVFVNQKLTPEEAEEVIRHEQNHLDRHHFIDIIFIEIVMVLQWFNPVIHLFNRALRTIHEYQADEGCLNSGISVINYQRLLLNQVFRSKVFSITNSFSNPTLIKKRMIMMTRKRSKTLANLKLFMVVPVIAAVMLFISSCSQNNRPLENAMEVAPPPPPPPPGVPYTVENGDTTWIAVQEMPEYQGGEAALLKYISENTSYPEIAKTNGTQGKVIVRFSVETDGKVNNVTILKGVDPELDKEAIRVVSTLPAFAKPGINDGKPVPVWYMVPITFTLK